MYVACSTMCFSRLSLIEALRIISELKFNKFEVAIHENGQQLKPSQVLADGSAAVAALRNGPGLIPSAFSVAVDASSTEEALKQFRAVCRLARITAVPLLCIDAAAVTTEFEEEVKRLTQLVALADHEGVLLTVSTLLGTHTETPERAAELCRLVPGLGLTLDPSHFTVGPNVGQSYDNVFPYVRHVHLRDTGRGPNQFQVRIGQGEIEYGRIITQLARQRYDRALTVDIRDSFDSPFPMEPEVRKLKYLLESLV